MAFNPKFGAFNKQITFSTITKIDDGYGGFTATYAPYATVWAYVKPLSMNEQLVRGQEAGTTTYDVWVQDTGDYNFTRQMKVTYNGKEFVINSVVEQDEDDRYFQFSMSAKDDIQTIDPIYLINALTETKTHPAPEGLKVFFVFDQTIDVDSIDKTYFTLKINTTATSPDLVTLSTDLKTVIATMPENDIAEGDAITISIQGGVIESVAGALLDTVSDRYIQNNVIDD